MKAVNCSEECEPESPRPACIRMIPHMANTQNGPSPWLGLW